MRIIIGALLLFSPLAAELPEPMQKIMNQPRYGNAIWGVYAKDLETREVFFDLNADKLFSPASTTKLFSTAALLHAFAKDHRFKTPIVATGEIKNGELNGSLVLIAQGDMTFGGRQPDADTISFTKMDHIIANEVPGTILTKEDPLFAMKDLAKQLYDAGLRKVNGDVFIDDSLFETTTKRGIVLSPISINENLIDIVLNPSLLGEPAKLSWRPDVPGYHIENQVVTGSKEDNLDIEVTADESKKKITVKGTIPIGVFDIVRVFPIQDPKDFARQAFIQAIENQGIVINAPKDLAPPAKNEYKKPLAVFVSPPISEMVKLILKVSHNGGADLIPLLLASHQGKHTFDEGMLLIGDFLKNEVHLSPNVFVFEDAAGGNGNRLTPKAEIELLDYMFRQDDFESYFNALPIMGVDGSLEDFAKKSTGATKIRSKPGTGINQNLATGNLFLITQALAGYIKGKNGNLFAYIVVVNNGQMQTIEDVYAIFEDSAQLSSAIYDETENKY